jgi:hypothetical protein
MVTGVTFDSRWQSQALSRAEDLAAEGTADRIQPYHLFREQGVRRRLRSSFESGIALGSPAGAELLHELGRFGLSDLNELVGQIAAFCRYQGPASFPYEIHGKRFIAFSSIFGVGTTKQTSWLLHAATPANNGVVNYLVWHLSLYG